MRAKLGPLNKHWHASGNKACQERLLQITLACRLLSTPLLPPSPSTNPCRPYPPFPSLYQLMPSSPFPPLPPINPCCPFSPLSPSRSLCSLTALNLSL